MLIPLTLLLLTFSLVTEAAQAKPLYKEVVTEKYEGPFPPFPLYAKGVTHRTVIVKDVDWEEGTIEVSLMTAQEYNLYEITDGEPERLVYGCS